MVRLMLVVLAVVIVVVGFVVVVASLVVIMIVVTVVQVLEVVMVNGGEILVAEMMAIVLLIETMVTVVVRGDGDNDHGGADGDDRLSLVPLSVCACPRACACTFNNLGCLCAAGCLNWTRRSSASSNTTQTVAPSRTASPAPSSWNM